MLTEPLEQFEIDYIKDVVARTAWSVESLSEKLERPEREIIEIVLQMGIKIRWKPYRIPFKSWEDLWYAYLFYGTAKAAAESIGMKYERACASIKRMKNMTEAERIVRWNMYRQKHGMALFTKC